MKRLIIVVCIILFATSLAFGQGIDKGQFEVSAAGGLALPMGDFGDNYSAGFLAGVNAGYYVSPILVVGGEFNFNKYPSKDEYLILLRGDDSTVTDINWWTIQASAYGKYFLKPENLSPYVKGMVGFYSNKEKVEAGSGNTDQTASDIGFAGGAGLQYKGPGMVGGFGEVMFHDILTEGSSTTYISFRVGVSFFLGKK